MKTNVLTVLLLAAAVSTKQQDKTGSSKVKDQDGANDQVTSILVHPGPEGPRHIILSNDHQILTSSGGGGFSSRTAEQNYHLDANYPPPPRVEDVEFHHTVPPPLSHVTYGPARPVQLHRGRPQQLYHHLFRQAAKIPHQKATYEGSKGLSDAIYKYSTYIKHDGHPKQVAVGGEKAAPLPLYSRQPETPDYTINTDERERQRSQPQFEGLSAYHTREEDEEKKFRESIGDIYSSDFGSSDYSDKKPKPLPFSKMHVKQQYIPNHKYYTANKNYQSPYNSFDEEPYHDTPSGFDDSNGGKVTPLLARFYKQPLPIIQTQLPPDNVGLYIQYYQPQRHDREEVTDNFFDYPEDMSLKRNYHTSDSEWTPINAPDGAVPAKAYDIPAPDLSLGKPVPPKVFRRGSDDEAVVLGKSKNKFSSSQHIQGNSEGVVSAVVRVKQ